MSQQPAESTRWNRERWLFITALGLLVLLFAFRFVHLGADFISDKKYTRDGVLYTDEGWYANNAIALYQTGQWYRPGELNFAVNLPVLQILHVGTFALLGVNIIAARTTIILCMAGSLLLLFLLVRRFEDPWTALLAVAWPVSNFFFYQYSRIALGEIPMGFFVLLAFYLLVLSGDRRPRLCAALAGVAWALAFYTKTSALFAVPLLGAAAFWIHWRSGRDRWLVPLALAAGAAAMVLLHTLLLALPYAEDYRYFLTLNVGMNAKMDLAVVTDFALHMIDHMLLIDKVMYRVVIVAVPLLLLFSPGFRRSPLVLFAIAWLAVYIAMFSFYVNFRPRYWAPLYLPAGTLIALALKYLLTDARPPWLRNTLVVVYTGALLLSLGRSLRDLASYQAAISYSFAEMAHDVEATIAADPDAPPILLGHFSTTVALYTGLVPVNDRFAPSPLAERLDRWEPRYLVTESDVRSRDHLDQHQTATAAEGGLRWKALNDHYAGIEEIRAYDVFDNYQGWPVFFYRLRPRN